MSQSQVVGHIHKMSIPANSHLHQIVPHCPSFHKCCGCRHLRLWRLQKPHSELQLEGRPELLEQFCLQEAPPRCPRHQILNRKVCLFKIFKFTSTFFNVCHQLHRFICTQGVHGFNQFLDIFKD